MTLKKYEEMFAAQGGKCAVCGNPPKPGKNLMVDHWHGCSCRGKKPTCGRCTRGLLDYKCNKIVVGIIERMKVDPQKVADYLNLHKDKHVNFSQKDRSNTRRRR